MTKQELEKRKGEVVREVHRLLIDLEELEGKVEEKEAEQKPSILDLYIPRGLVNIHRLPRLRL